MAKYFDRLSSVLEAMKEQDRAVDESTTLAEVKKTMETANYFNIRLLTINTAIIADVLDRISTDRTDLSIDDLIKMIGDK